MLVRVHVVIPLVHRDVEGRDVPPGHVHLSLKTRSEKDDKRFKFELCSVCYLMDTKSPLLLDLFLLTMFSLVYGLLVIGTAFSTHFLLSLSPTLPSVP